jgi:hypothetical protein
VGGASAGLESVAVLPADAKSCAQHQDAAATSCTPVLEQAMACILDFLSEYSSTNKIFHVQGWRWHTLSLARDARRLGNLASSLMQNTTLDTEDKSLEKAVHHVIEFNMKALHRIENKLFFPWLRAQLTSVDDPDLAEAFSVVLDDIIASHKMVAKVGLEVVSFVMIYR